MTCPAELTLNGKTYHCARTGVFHTKHKAIDYAGVVGVMSTPVRITWRQVEATS